MGGVSLSAAVHMSPWGRREGTLYAMSCAPSEGSDVSVSGDDSESSSSQEGNDASAVGEHSDATFSREGDDASAVGERRDATFSREGSDASARSSHSRSRSQPSLRDARVLKRRPTAARCAGSLQDPRAGAVSSDMGMPVVEIERKLHVDAHMRGVCRGVKHCAQCKWIKLGRGWQKAVAITVGGVLKSPIMERPRSWGGRWAIGCSVCAQAGLSGNYAKFKVRTALQKVNILSHGAGANHRDAVKRFLDPGLEALGTDRNHKRKLCDVEDIDAAWGSEIAGAPPATTFVQAMKSFHASVSARSTDSVSDLHNFFADADSAVDSERSKMSAAWQCLAEAIDNDARAFVRDSDDGRRAFFVSVARANFPMTPPPSKVPRG